MASLELVNIRKIFGSNTVVENFNLRAESGEFISFLGPSGCGKTTTLRMIAGFETPSHGQIMIDDKEISRQPPNQRNIGMVFQSYGLFPNLTAGDNIGFGLKIRKQPKEAIEKKVKELLGMIHLADKINSYPYQLSGGQQQRVALVRALAIEPQVLLLDEPLSALDAKIRVELRSEIRSIQRKLGITTIYVTHDQEEALSLSDRIVVMKDGRIEQIGTPFDIYNFPQTQFVASFVGMLNMVEAHVVDAVKGQLEISGQIIQVPAPITRGNADKAVRLALRPEILHLQATPEDINHINCQIETITFLGSVVRIQVSLGKAQIFFDTFNNPHLSLPKVGEQIQIHFAKEPCLVL